MVFADQFHVASFSDPHGDSTHTSSFAHKPDDAAERIRVGEYEHLHGVPSFRERIAALEDELRQAAHLVKHRLASWEHARQHVDRETLDEYQAARSRLDQAHINLRSNYNIRCRPMHDLEQPCEATYRKGHREFLARQPTIECLVGVTTPFATPTTESADPGILGSLRELIGF